MLTFTGLAQLHQRLLPLQRFDAGAMPASIAHAHFGCLVASARVRLTNVADSSLQIDDDNKQPATWLPPVIDYAEIVPKEIKERVRGHIMDEICLIVAAVGTFGFTLTPTRASDVAVP